MNMGAFPSGQWGQTVNLLLNASVVRIHQLPPTGCDKKDVTAFFLCCNAKKWRFRRPIFKVVFYKVVQPFHCGWAFLLPFFHSGAPALWEK